MTKNNHDNNEKELAFLKQLGIENPSPDQLRDALKDLASRNVILKYNIKKDKK